MAISAKRAWKWLFLVLWGAWALGLGLICGGEIFRYYHPPSEHVARALTRSSRSRPAAPPTVPLGTFLVLAVLVPGTIYVVGPRVRRRVRARRRSP